MAVCVLFSTMTIVLPCFIVFAYFAHSRVAAHTCFISTETLCICRAYNTLLFEIPCSRLVASASFTVPVLSPPPQRSPSAQRTPCSASKSHLSSPTPVSSLLHQYFDFEASSTALSCHIARGLHPKPLAIPDQEKQLPDVYLYNGNHPVNLHRNGQRSTDYVIILDLDDKEVMKNIFIYGAWVSISNKYKHNSGNLMLELQDFLFLCDMNGNGNTLHDIMISCGYAISELEQDFQDNGAVVSPPAATIQNDHTGLAWT
ncbi:hypothetical protein DFH06DRAFT_1338750 [Mycena polygramma]|nr:hypothetical protein DFH06DRAFT_1338750 [Mycena polygramma]